jgi:hypothetical protein
MVGGNEIFKVDENGSDSPLHGGRRPLGLRGMFLWQFV